VPPVAVTVAVTVPLLHNGFATLTVAAKVLLLLVMLKLTVLSQLPLLVAV